MSESDGFFARWSALKRAAAKNTAKSNGKSTDKGTTQGGRPGGEARLTHEPGQAPAGPVPATMAAPAADIASLPPLESIQSNSDIRAFLRAGIPQALARAALRRAWQADPAIRDFIGIAENQWDFTADDAIPGFGPLDPAHGAAGVLAMLSATASERGAVPAALPDGPPAAALPAAPETTRFIADPVWQAKTPAAPAPDRPREPQPAQERAQEPPVPHRRSHGGALPR